MKPLLNIAKEMVWQQHRKQYANAYSQQPRISQSRRGEVKANESLCELDNGFPADTHSRQTKPLDDRDIARGRIIRAGFNSQIDQHSLTRKDKTADAYSQQTKPDNILAISGSTAASGCVDKTVDTYNHEDALQDASYVKNNQWTVEEI